MLKSRNERCRISIPLQHVVKYSHFQKKLLIINGRKVYLQLKLPGCWYTSTFESDRMVVDLH